MKTLLLLVVVAMATGSAIRDNPCSEPPCQTMDQWEGRSSEWNHITESNNRFLISFDGVGLRKRVKEEKKSFMPGKRFYEYIMEYKTNTLYTIRDADQTCTVTNLTQPWQNHTIPADATCEDEFEIGPPGSGIMVTEWSDRLPARRAESWIGVFTEEGCWPVVEVFTDDEPTNPVSLTTRFFDFTPGIKNMSVFTPPSYCGPKYGHVQPEFDGDTNDASVITFIGKGWNYLTTWF